MSEREWQAAEGSNTLHVIDTSKPVPDRSGPKSLCGKRPQRNHREWFSLSVTETIFQNGPLPYHLVKCRECDLALADSQRDLV